MESRGIEDWKIRKTKEVKRKSAKMQHRIAKEGKRSGEEKTWKAEAMESRRRGKHTGEEKESRRPGEYKMLYNNKPNQEIQTKEKNCHCTFSTTPIPL